MRKLLLLFFASVYTGIAIGQCGLTITTPTDSVACGGCFTLTAVGDENAPLLNENFNNQNLGSGWML